MGLSPWLLEIDAVVSGSETFGMLYFPLFHVAVWWISPTVLQFSMFGGIVVMPTGMLHLL